MNDETFIISYTPGKHLIQRLNGSTKIILLVATVVLAALQGVAEMEEDSVTNNIL